MLALILIDLTPTGCVRQTYHAQPVSPPAVLSSIEARRLDAPGLKKFMEANFHRPVGPWPMKSWDLKSLTLAAYYFNPQLETERTRVATAEAAVVTAGMKPNPTLNVAPGIPSPYLLDLNLPLPVVTHNKRELRIESAKDLSDSARLTLANAEWKVRSAVRAELVSYSLAVRQAALLGAEEQFNSDHEHLLENEARAGEIARPQVDEALRSLATTRVALQAAEGQIPVTKAALAGAIGVPATALDSVRLVWPDFDRPPAAESVSGERVQRDAVLNRLDVRAALANYAAAESNLKFEIARQYPDFQIGPGYQYEETNNFFVVGFSVPLPVFNHNEGPIAEAEARRKEAAAAFLATQATVIAESEAALARYRAAMKELSVANTLLTRIQNTREKETELAAAAGELDREAVVLVRLEGSSAAMAQLSALGQAQSALGALEDAVQMPLDPEDQLSAPHPSIPPAGLEPSEGTPPQREEHHE